MKKTKKHSCDCEMNEDVAHHIKLLIPAMSKNIHEGMFRGIGQRAKILGQQAVQMGREIYNRGKEDIAYKSERQLSASESGMVHPKVAKMLGVNTATVRDAINNPQHNLHGSVHMAIQTDPQLRSINRQITNTRQRNMRMVSDANRVLSSQIRTPQEQAARRNAQAQYAANYGRPFDAKEFDRLNPVNPSLYRQSLGQTRQGLQTARRQQIDQSIIRGAADYAFGKRDLRSKVSNVLNKSPRLARVFKAVDTII